MSLGKLMIAHRMEQLSRLLDGFEPSYDNLHRIAISNLEGENFDSWARSWWESKFRQPLKAYDDHTMEELAIKIFEDFYRKNPEEIKKFQMGEIKDDWDGTVDAEHEKQIKERIKKIDQRNRVDIKKYQSDKVLTEEEEKKILLSLGQKVEDKRMLIGDDEFEDVFGG